jgi:N-hydroxyarylamine O-acetyltransferase
VSHAASAPGGLGAELVQAYLDRLGLGAEDVRADAASLVALQRAHLMAVPFENLSVHLGEPIVLEPTLLVDKLTRRHRGGFCYELNGAFAALLEAIGFTVSRFEARVYVGPDQVGIPFDHLCLGVEAGETYLVDVGFGAAFSEPLLLHTRGPQADPAGPFEVIRRDDGWYDLVGDEGPQYRFSTTPRLLSDFDGGCRHHQTSPASHFTRNTVCSIQTPAGRTTVRGHALIVTEHGERTESVLDDDELLRVYRDVFGISLDRAPQR